MRRVAVLVVVLLLFFPLSYLLAQNPENSDETEAQSWISWSKARRWSYISGFYSGNQHGVLTTLQYVVDHHLLLPYR